MMRVKRHFLVAGFITASFLGSPAALAANWPIDAASCGVLTNTLASFQITLPGILVLCAIIFFFLHIGGVLGTGRSRETDNRQMAELRRQVQQRDRQLQQLLSQVREFERQLTDILPRFENPGSRLHLDEHGNLREEN